MIADSCRVTLGGDGRGRPSLHERAAETPKTALALERMQHAEGGAPIRPHQHECILTIRHAG